MNKKLLVVGVVVVAALAITAAFITLNNKEEDKTPKAGETVKPKENKELDTEKQQSLQEMVRQIVYAATTQQVRYPESTSNGWTEAVNLVDRSYRYTIIDPFTSHYYQYVTKQTTPNYDQIQYAPGYTCGKDEKFVVGGIRDLAVRTKFSTGIKCVDHQIDQKQD
ncbi:MAG TPA: hypothetical protein VLA92_01295 [Candidatus Saccharimonadales bacterium]|nr:hypothetical protein [Candidatus Saccharimonadales bacterium]